MKSSQVLVIIGGIGIALSLILIFSSVGTTETSELVSEFQNDISSNIVWNGTADVNETISLDSNYLWVWVSQGSNISDLKITDEEGSNILNLENCKDSNIDDGIEDCKDYQHYSLGYIKFEESVTRSDEYYYSSNTNEVIVEFNGTGELILIDGSAAWSDIENTAGGAFVSWLAKWCGGGFICCIGIFLIVIGAILSSTGIKSQVVPDPLGGMRQNEIINRKII